MNNLQIVTYKKTTFTLYAKGKSCFSGTTNYSTLKRFADHSNVCQIADEILAELAHKFADSDSTVAIDSTGLKSTSASAHFYTRNSRSRMKYAKLSVAILCSSLIPVGLVTSWGPCNDKSAVAALLGKSPPPQVLRFCLPMPAMRLNEFTNPAMMTVCVQMKYSSYSSQGR